MEELLWENVKTYGKFTFTYMEMIDRYVVQIDYGKDFGCSGDYANNWNKALRNAVTNFLAGYDPTICDLLVMTCYKKGLFGDFEPLGAEGFAYHGEVFVVYPDPDKTCGYRIEDREGNRMDKTEFTLSTPNRNELESILGCARNKAENFEMLAYSMLEPFWFDYEYYN